MAITKTIVRVGGINAVEPNSQLPMFRRFTTFEGSLDIEYIKVYYEEWLEANGIKVNHITKHYMVKDCEEISHVVVGDPNATPPTEDQIIIDQAVYPAFSLGWFYKKIKATASGLSIGGVIVAPLDYELDFGKDLIANVINQTLVAMDFSVPNGYVSQP